MDTGRIRHEFVILLFCGLSFAWLPLCATTRYVVPAGTAGNVPASPYESWEGAANDLNSVLSVGRPVAREQVRRSRLPEWPAACGVRRQLRRHHVRR